MQIRRATFIAGVLVTNLCLSFPTAHAASNKLGDRYWETRNNLAFSINYHAAIKPLMIFKNMHYASDYHNNGRICTTARFVVRLTDINLSGRSEVPLLRTGQSFTTIEPRIKFQVREDRCRLGTISGYCIAIRPITIFPGEGSQSFETKCHAQWDGLEFVEADWKQTFEVKIPFNLPSHYTLKLPVGSHPPGKSTASVRATFAEYRNSQWSELPEPRNSEKVVSAFPDLLFHPAPANVPSITNPLYQHTGGDHYLTFNAFTDESLLTRDGKVALLSHFGPVKELTTNPKAFATLRLREGFIAPRNIQGPTSPRTGILGSYFPLLLVVRPSADVDVAIRVVLGGATARIKPDGLSLQISVDEVSFGGATRAGEVKLLNSSIELDPPRLTSDGRLHLEVKRADLDIEYERDGKKRIVALGPQLQGLLNSSLPDIATVRSLETFRTPECIFVDNDRIDAAHRCASENGALDKRMSNDDTLRESSLVLDLAATRIEAFDGFVDVHFYKTEP